MAVRTVSAAGGNFNATGTWVGGVVPISGDSIVANATSGNLTLTANAPTSGGLVGADFTGYTGTFALGSFNFVVNAGPIVLGSGMTITNTASGRIQFGGTPGSTLTSNGVTIPNLTWQSALTLIGDARVNSLNQQPSSAISGANVIFTGSSLNVNSLNFASGAKLILRPTGGLGLNFGANGMAGILQIDTTNPITLNDYIRLDIPGGVGNALEITQNTTWNSPTINPRILYSKITNTSRIDAGTYSITFNEIIFQSAADGNIQTVNINSPNISVGNLIIDPAGSGGTNNTTAAVIQGTYSFSSIKSIYCPSYTVYTGSAQTQKNSSLTLKGGFTYSVTERLLIGGAGNVRSVLGSSPSNTNIYFTGLTYSITNAALNNINFISPTVTFNYLNNTNVLPNANTTGISLLTPGGSFTFVN